MNQKSHVESMEFLEMTFIMFLTDFALPLEVSSAFCDKRGLILVADKRISMSNL